MYICLMYHFFCLILGFLIIVNSVKLYSRWFWFLVKYGLLFVWLFRKWGRFSERIPVSKIVLALVCCYRKDGTFIVPA